MPPLVTVVMPAFNASSHISHAINSILSQTFADFELLVIDDGSTDGTASIVRSYTDRRIRLVSHERNRGLSAARNIGLGHAAGEFIAWLDADDWSQPDRLGWQVSVMRRNPDVGICGGWVRPFGGVENRRWTYPKTDRYLRTQLLFDDPLATSAVMMRRSLFTEGQIQFDPEMAPAEDYDYWQRASALCRLVTIPRVLAHYRLHEGQTSARHRDRQRRAVKVIQSRQLFELGLTPTPGQWCAHLALGVDWGRGTTRTLLVEATDWMGILEEANIARGLYPARTLRSVLRQRLRIMRNALEPNSLRLAVIKLHTARHVGGPLIKQLHR